MHADIKIPTSGNIGQKWGTRVGIPNWGNFGHVTWVPPTGEPFSDLGICEKLAS